MLDRNLVFPLLVILFSAIAFFLIGQFDDPMYQEASVDAKFFPRVIVLGLIILSVALLIQYKLDKRNSSDGTAIFSKLSLFGLGFLISYTLLIHLVGYLIASLVAFIAYLIFFKVKKPLYYVVAIGFVFGIYYLFGTVFVIVLPEGSLL